VIHLDSRVVDIEEHADGVTVKTGSGKVRADHVVVATNTPINDRVEIHTKQPGYMTYAIAAASPGSVDRALYWDTGDPYHYVRSARGRALDGAPADFVIVGGEDHRTGQADDTDARHARLEAWARERMPGLGAVEYAWSGQVMESIDGLAYIGRNPLDADNVFVATGDSGMGITHGTIAGTLLCDPILGRRNRFAALYEPSRKSLRAAGPYLRENLVTAAQYADWLAPADVESVAQIAPDSGAVLRRGMARVAVYRGARGALHERSAKCTHLGCVVAWNDSDKTWDCPCHGSRFDRFGKVIHGPANRNLGPAGKG
jgi:nitrite reductase/ring-hydroxylating ferredoxin subunit